MTDVAETLHVPCFQYCGQPLLAPLVIESGDAARSFVRCLIRGRLVCLTPEERVRQALIWFLTTGSNRAAVIRQHFRIGVEERSLDVAGFAPGEGRFAPYVTVGIIETKRLEADLANHVGQLQDYMLRERCRAGLLFNGQQASWRTLNGDFANPDWEEVPLADLSEVEQRIESTALTASDFMQDCRQQFAAAQRGNVDALLRLVALFGADTGLTFTLSIRAKGSIGSVRAFNLNITAGEVGYRVRGVATRHRQKLSKAEFHSLLSVLPI